MSCALCIFSVKLRTQKTYYTTQQYPHFEIVEMDMYSETDSTNECSDFKSELDEEDLEGAGNGNAPGAGGQHAGHAGPSRKSSGLSKRNNRHPRVVFV